MPSARLRDTPDADAVCGPRSESLLIENRRAARSQHNASGRLVDPDGIGTMILTLCLPQSRDINGAAVTIDGGTSA